MGRSFGVLSLFRPRSEYLVVKFARRHVPVLFRWITKKSRVLSPVAAVSSE